MKRIIITFSLLAVVVTGAFAQDSQGNQEEPVKKGFDKSRLFVGGSFGLAFGTYTLINVSPQAGYMFNRYFAAGVGINAIYSSQKNSYGETWEQGVAGMNVFGRVYPIPQLFAQLQPEMNYIWGSYSYGGSKSSLNGTIIPSLLLGAGGIIPMGRSGGFVIMAQYDLLNKMGTGTNPGTPYGSNVFFSVGVNVGL
ncbi:hypothetical protein [Flavihumibacter profundi]|uniref:hypothetical protein n=1 Tax=Flavihumibacter profundi TaxID=2716883 RepID=UPI001CC6FF8D|nr:hypothetical protein [Flavihumibacter profundi]MBZ5859270.1 hypothetical protein [Flavihumibacter profundi]